MAHGQRVKVTKKAVVCPDADVLAVHPFLQGHGDAADPAAVLDGVAMMEAELLPQHVQVQNVAITDMELDPAVAFVVAPQVLIHQPFVAGRMGVVGLHFDRRAAMVAVAARNDDLLKAFVLQQIIQTCNDRSFTLDQLLCWAQLLGLYLFWVYLVVDHVAAKPDHDPT